MKIIVTGTHFTPAQAVIEELKKDPRAEIVYIGRKNTREGDRSPSVESEILPKLGIKFVPITTGRLQRSFTIYTIPSLLKIPFGFLQSLYLLTKEKPDVVLSFGGYVGVPVVVSAWLLSIPVIIHEQTLMPGLANRISGWFADKIALTLPIKGYPEEKTVITGNPLRKELVGEDKKAVENHAKLPIIYITGGNQGSHAINLAVKECLPNLTEIACVIHQCGDSKFNDFEDLEQLRKALDYPQRYKVSKWIDAKEVGELFRKADLVVTRAGMNTLLEVSYFGKPMLIIPLPVHKEQSANARYFEKIGSAKILWQKDLTAGSLLKSIKEVLGVLGELEERAKGAREIIIPDAGRRVALETIVLASTKK